ncbi:MAG: protoporphyrinogen oxidase [Candidatus Rokuibacteriota bacterium]
MRLVVVGGGIAGLAAAHRAVELARERNIALDLTILESRDRLGGTIETERAGGFLVEAGPDSFLSEKPWALALCRRLGLEPRLVGTDDRFRRTFVWFKGRLHPLPEGFQLLAPTRLRPFLASRLLSWPGKARMALDVILPRGAGGADESLGAFVRRRLGREALERIAQPLVAGIYTADPEELSLQATLPRFLELERTQRSLIIGLWRSSRRGPAASGISGARWSLFVTLAGGMSELVQTLAARLPAGAVHLKRRVNGVVRRAAGWAVDGGGTAVEADRLIVAVEAHTASRLLRYVDPALVTLLQVIPYASSATVSFGYPRAAIRHPLDGFGFVVPRVEGRALLACTFSSVKYPGRAPEGYVLLRCFLGGALSPGVLAGDDEALVGQASRELAAAIGAVGEPMLVRVTRHSAAMPQYVIGHLGTLETIDQRLRVAPGLFLAGAAYRGVGIADCVKSGEAAAERALLPDTPSAAP